MKKLKIKMTKKNKKMVKMGAIAGVAALGVYLGYKLMKRNGNTLKGKFMGKFSKFVNPNVSLEIKKIPTRFARLTDRDLVAY